MNILTKKAKEEIRTLIHRIEYCKTYLATLEPIRERLYVERNKFDPTGWVELEFDTTMKIAETKVLLDNTRQRLRELGVY